MKINLKGALAPFVGAARRFAAANGVKRAVDAAGKSPLDETLADLGMFLVFGPWIGKLESLTKPELTRLKALDKVFRGVVDELADVLPAKEAAEVREWLGSTGWSTDGAAAQAWEETTAVLEKLLEILARPAASLRQRQVDGAPFTEAELAQPKPQAKPEGFVEELEAELQEEAERAAKAEAESETGDLGEGALSRRDENGRLRGNAPDAQAGSGVVAAEERAGEPIAKPKTAAELKREEQHRFLDAAEVNSLWSRFERAFSDKNVAVIRFTKAVIKLGGTGKAKPVSAVARYYGKVANRGERLERDFFEPIAKTLRTHRIKPEDAGVYLEARHIPEANEQFYQYYLELQRRKKEVVPLEAAAKRRGASQEAVRAWTEAKERIETLHFVDKQVKPGIDPRTYFHEHLKLAGGSSRAAMDLEQQQSLRPGYKEVGAQFDGMTKAMRKGMLDDGLISRDTYNRLENQFKHYAPLKDVDPDFDALLGRGGFDAGGRPFERREGRGDHAANPLAVAQVDAMRLVQMGEKNRVGRELFDFFMENASIVRAQRRVPRRGVNGVWDLEATEFLLKVDGEHTALKIESESLAAAMKGIDVPRLPGFIRSYAAGFGVWKSLVTTLSPNFIVRNGTKDLQTALYQVGSVQTDVDLKGIRLQMARGLPRAFKTALDYARNKEKSSPDALVFREYLDAGGSIGTYNALDFEQELERLQKRASAPRMRGSVARGAAATLDVVQDYNRAVETALRFSLFRALRERGADVGDAALAARKLTTDFNQTGTYGHTVSLIYAFFSASIGGTRRALEGFRDRPKEMAGIAAALTAAGALRAFWNDAMSDEDEDGIKQIDKVDGYTKGTKMVFILPGGKEFTIPKTWVYGFFDNLGRLAYEAHAGKMTSSEVMEAIGVDLAANFSPLGGAASLEQMLIPTVAAPFYQVHENRNWMGSRIAPEQFGNGPEVAAYPNSGAGTFAPYVMAAKALNWATGGNDVEPGYYNLAGDHIEYLLEFAAGGPMKFAQRVIDVANGGRPLKEAPFIQNFIAPEPVYYDMEVFFDARDEITEVKARIQRLREKGEGEKAAELERRWKPVLSLESSARQAVKQYAGIKNKAAEENWSVPREELKRALVPLNHWNNRWRAAMRQVELSGAEK